MIPIKARDIHSVREQILLRKKKKVGDSFDKVHFSLLRHYIYRYNQ